MKYPQIIVLMLILLGAPVAGVAQQPAGNGNGAGNGEEWTEFEDPFAEEPPDIKVADPLEPLNRGIFWVNDKLYFYLFKPVARGLRVVPEPARISVSNFFSNLTTPVRFVNSVLQLKLTDASGELARFIINSTLGIGGLFDRATDWGGPRKKKEDFGQTLGHYGVGSGFYLVLPVLGPSNPRDALGRFADSYLEPTSYLDWEEELALKVAERENQLSLDADTYEDIKEKSIDPYLTIRNGYEQRRRGLIRK